MTRPFRILPVDDLGPYRGAQGDPRTEECPRELGELCDGCVYSGSCGLQDMFAAEAEAEQ